MTGNGDREARRGADQRHVNAPRKLGERNRRRALHRMEGFHHADDRAEKPEQGRDIGNGRKDIQIGFETGDLDEGLILDRLPEIMRYIGEDGLLIVVSDHGCDPCHTGTDHTREHVPVLVWNKKMEGGVNLGVRETYADLSATVLDFFGVQNTVKGTSMLDEMK